MNVDERRQHQRLRPKDLTFVALRPDFTQFGKILDINGGGLCFQYMIMDKPPYGSARQADIFISANDTTL